MHQLSTIIKRDLKLIYSNIFEAISPLIFFLIICFIFSFSVLESETLSRVSNEIILTTIILSLNINQKWIFERDLSNGMLQQIRINCDSLKNFILAKIISNWLCFGLPLAIFSLVGLIFLQNSENLFKSSSVFILATLIFSAVNVMISSITAGLKNGNIINIILSMPLYIPLIVTTLSFLDDSKDVSYNNFILNILGFALVVIPLSIVMGAAAIKIAAEE